MPEQALNWNAEALWEQLEPLLPGLSIEVVAQTSSTNSALVDRTRMATSELTRAARRTSPAASRSAPRAEVGYRAVDVQPCLLVAEHQSEGRGRQGRAWQSRAGASLTFSLGLPLALADWSGLSLAVGVSLCEALDPVVPHDRAWRIGLKWPNDLWLMEGAADGRKLGGILIETVAAPGQRLAIIGVGLNVQPFDVGPLSTGFATVSELDPATSAPLVLARVAAPLVRALKLFEKEGFAAFAERFAQRDLLRGLPIRTTGGDASAGIACGVSPQGALLVQTPRGVASVSSGEVSVRLLPPSTDQK